MSGWKSIWKLCSDTVRRRDLVALPGTKTETKVRKQCLQPGQKQYKTKVTRVPFNQCANPPEYMKLRRRCR